MREVAIPLVGFLALPPFKGAFFACLRSLVAAEEVEELELLVDVEEELLLLEDEDLSLPRRFPLFHSSVISIFWPSDI